MRKAIFLSLMAAAAVLAGWGVRAQDAAQPAAPPSPQPVPVAEPTTPTNVAPTPLVPATPTPDLLPATTEPPKAEAPKEPAPAKPKPKAPTIPTYSGTLAKADRVSMTLAVDVKGKSRIFQVTSKTRFYKNKKPATFADAVEGEKIAVTAKAAKKGKAEAVAVRYVTGK